MSGSAPRDLGASACAALLMTLAALPACNADGGDDGAACGTTGGAVDGAWSPVVED